MEITKKAPPPPPPKSYILELNHIEVNLIIQGLRGSNRADITEAELDALVKLEDLLEWAQKESRVL